MAMARRATPPTEAPTMPASGNVFFEAGGIGKEVELVELEPEQLRGMRFGSRGLERASARPNLLAV